ncbi:hypothetical protein FS749_003762 [Ceratobasidium sp. UAMH 11750]|nr:hypothetical protein FS749_003762 [Ceratobasidium sp. UAMH 11750]
MASTAPVKQDELHSCTAGPRFTVRPSIWELRMISEFSTDDISIFLTRRSRSPGYDRVITGTAILLLVFEYDMGIDVTKAAVATVNPDVVHVSRSYFSRHKSSFFANLLGLVMLAPSLVSRCDAS